MAMAGNAAVLLLPLALGIVGILAASTGDENSLKRCWPKWRGLHPVGVGRRTIILAATKFHRLKPAPLEHRKLRDIRLRAQRDFPAIAPI
jgi:hypothetical protein